MALPRGSAWMSKEGSKGTASSVKVVSRSTQGTTVRCARYCSGGKTEILPDTTRACGDSESRIQTRLVDKNGQRW